jgi:hypothetical protein
MPYGWSSRNRLCPARMVEIDHSYPRYETVKYRRPQLRKMTRLELPQPSKVEELRWNSDSPPGRLGEWPVFKYGRRIRRPQ